MVPKKPDEDLGSLEEQLFRLVGERLAPAEADNDPERVAARNSLLAFTKYTKPDYSPNWHHLILFDHLEKWVEGKITRLMVFAPAQTGKSEAVSRKLPAYVLGKNPDARVIACSHTASLAAKMSRAVQRTIDSEPYRQLFPNTRLPTKRSRNEEAGKRTALEFEIAGRAGSYTAAGVRGGITGSPATYLIVDDPIKDDQDANSATIREATFNWYATTLSSRKTEAGARILLTLTRWHQLDLAGQLLALSAKDPKADQWVVLKFPHILETEAQRQPYDHRQVGEVLWPERHPLAEVEAERAMLPRAKWSALHQQEPTPADGTVFRQDDFRYFTPKRDARGRMLLVLQDAPDGSETREFLAADCRWFQTADPADKAGAGNSHTGVLTACRTPEGDLCVWHVWRARLELPARYRRINELRAGPHPGGRWPAEILFTGLEDKASGIGMHQTAAAEGRPFRKLKPGTQDKVARAAAVSTLYDAHKAFHLKAAPWLTDFERELLAFGPAAAETDQADCLAYAGQLCASDPFLRFGRGDLDGELLAWPPAPRDSEGNVSLAGTSLEENANVYQVGRHTVRFEDDEDRAGWWEG